MTYRYLGTALVPGAQVPTLDYRRPRPPTATGFVPRRLWLLVLCGRIRFRDDLPLSGLDKRPNTSAANEPALSSVVRCEVVGATVIVSGRNRPWVGVRCVRSKYKLGSDSSLA
jgi:hypothetical protein